MSVRKIQMMAKAEVAKARRLVFGYAVICKVDGRDYEDTQGDVVTEEDMIDAALDFMKNSRAVNDSHDGGPDHGENWFATPMTEGIAKSLDMTWTPEAASRKHGPGLIVGAQISKEMFDLVEKGERAMWSIEGECDRIPYEPGAVAKATRTAGLKIHKISLVRLGAQEGADITYVAKSRDITTPGAPTMATTETNDLTVNKELQAKIAELTATLAAGQAELAKAHAWGKLSDAHREHALTLEAGAERDAFVAKSAGEREAVVKAAIAADETYTTMDGQIVRKSIHGELALRQAKKLDEQAISIAKANAEREDAVLKSRAVKLFKHSTMKEPAQVALLRSVSKIEDAAIRAEVEKALEAYDEAASLPFRRMGAGDGDPAFVAKEGGGQELVRKAVRERIAKTGEKFDVALKAVMSDPQMRKAYDEDEVPKASADIAADRD